MLTNTRFRIKSDVVFLKQNTFGVYSYIIKSTYVYRVQIVEQYLIFVISRFKRFPQFWVSFWGSMFWLVETRDPNQ